MPITQDRFTSAVNIGMRCYNTLLQAQSFVRGLRGDEKFSKDQIIEILISFFVDQIPSPLDIKPLMAEQAHFSSSTMRKNEAARIRQIKHRRGLTKPQLERAARQELIFGAPPRPAPVPNPTDRDLIDYYIKTGKAMPSVPAPMPAPVPAPTLSAYQEGGLPSGVSSGTPAALGANFLEPDNEV